MELEDNSHEIVQSAPNTGPFSWRAYAVGGDWVGLEASALISKVALILLLTNFQPWPAKTWTKY